jgi:hypothetical protein
MKRLLVIGTLCLLADVSPAAAEWHFTPMAGITFGGNTNLKLLDWERATGDAHPNFGGAVTLLGGGLIGIEGIGISTPGLWKGSDSAGTAALFSGTVPVKESRSYALMGNVVLTAPRRWTEYGLRPFVSGGFGLVHTSAVDAVEAFPLTLTSGGFNIGGGAIGFFSARTGMRFDLRYYSTLNATASTGGEDLGDVHLRYMSLSIGLVLRR